MDFIQISIIQNNTNCIPIHKTCNYESYKYDIKYHTTLDTILNVVRATIYNNIKQCAFIHVGPKNITMGWPDLVLRDLD